MHYNGRIRSVVLPGWTADAWVEMAFLAGVMEVDVELLRGVLSSSGRYGPRVRFETGTDRVRAAWSKKGK